jgi:Glycosyltransferase family 87
VKGQRWGGWKEQAPAQTAKAPGPLPAVTIAILLGIFALSVPIIILELTIGAAGYDMQSNAGHDFRLIYSAAHALWLHHNPYDPGVFAKQALDDGMPRQYPLDKGTLSQPYVYPPIFAWLLAPLTLFKLETALFLWRALSVLLVFLGTFMLIWARPSDGVAHFVSKRDCVILSAVLAASPLTAYAIYWGNPVVLVYAALGGWVYALQKRSTQWDFVAGALMGVSLLKPQLALPLALITFACFARGDDTQHRLRSIFFGFGTFIGAFLALDILVTPPSLLVAWPRSIVYLSKQLSLQPDMPSLYGLLKYIVPAIGHVSAAPVGIAAIGGVAVIALYQHLHNSWRPTALLGLLSAVWCFVTPYAHGNDQMLFVPGALALGTALQAGVIRPFTQAKTFHRRQVLQRSVDIAIITLAIAALWLGPTILVIHFSNHDLPMSVAIVVAPLLILMAFVATGPLHRQSPIGTNLPVSAQTN